MSYRSLACIALVGCGRLHFDDLALGPDDGPLPDGCAFGTWSAPMLLASASSPSNDQAPSLTDDGLDLVFESDRPGGAGLMDLYEATRPTSSAAFGAPVPLPFNTVMFEDGPSLSSDGLAIYFCRSPNSMPGPCVLEHATRPTRASPFGAPQVVPQIADAWGPFATRDGRELFYTTFSTGLERATLADVPTPVGPVAEINSGGISGFATVTADGLTIFFEGERGVDATDSIYTATRPAVGMPFGAVTRVDELSSAFHDDDPDVSNLDRTLVFSTDRPGGVGGYDLYVSTRSCE